MRNSQPPPYQRNYYTCVMQLPLEPSHYAFCYRSITDKLPHTLTPNPHRYDHFRQTKEYSHQCTCPPRHYAGQDRDRPVVVRLDGKSDPVFARTISRSCESACPTPANSASPEAGAHRVLAPNERIQTAIHANTVGVEKGCIHNLIFFFPPFSMSAFAMSRQHHNISCTHAPRMHRHLYHTPRFGPSSAPAPPGSAPVPSVP